VDLTLVLVSATIIGLVTGSQWEPRNALSVNPSPCLTRHPDFGRLSPRDSSTPIDFRRASLHQAQ
jgi:hypothetical protein